MSAVLGNAAMNLVPGRRANEPSMLRSRLSNTFAYFGDMLRSVSVTFRPPSNERTVLTCKLLCGCSPRGFRFALVLAKYMSHTRDWCPCAASPADVAFDGVA